MYYVYVLRSIKSGRLYTGYTENLRKRLSQHAEQKSKYTKHRGSYELIYYEASKHRYDAMARELYLKSGMGKRYLRNRMKNYFSSVS